MGFAIKPVRIRINAGGNEHSSLESLKEIFNFQELQPLISDGRLIRWLKQIGEQEMVTKLSLLTSQKITDKLIIKYYNIFYSFHYSSLDDIIENLFNSEKYKKAGCFLLFQRRKECSNINIAQYLYKEGLLSESKYIDLINSSILYKLAFQTNDKEIFYWAENRHDEDSNIYRQTREYKKLKGENCIGLENNYKIELKNILTQDICNFDTYIDKCRSKYNNRDIDILRFISQVIKRMRSINPNTGAENKMEILNSLKEFKFPMAKFIDLLFQYYKYSRENIRYQYDYAYPYIKHEIEALAIDKFIPAAAMSVYQDSVSPSSYPELYSKDHNYYKAIQIHRIFKHFYTKAEFDKLIIYFLERFYEYNI